MTDDSALLKFMAVARDLRRIDEKARRIKVILLKRHGLNWTTYRQLADAATDEGAALGQSEIVNELGRVQIVDKPMWEHKNSRFLGNKHDIIYRLP